MRRRHRLKNKPFTALMASPYIVWAIAFVIIPLLMVFYYGFTNNDGAFTMENIAAIADPRHLKALGIAMALSVISTIICILLAYPLALILANKKGSQDKIIIMIFILPMWMNFLLRILAWQTLLEKSGVINTIIEGFNKLPLFDLPTLNIINTPYAIILGMVYNFLPFMILPLYNVLSKIDPNVINAAKDLGANSIHTFIRIILPLSVPGIISGVTMVFVPALTTFAISAMLGGSKISLIGNIIEQEFSTASNWHLGSGLSIVLMIFIIISMIFSAIFDKDGEGNML